MNLSETIATEDDLGFVMTEPDEALLEFVSSIRSPLIVLGGSGKMGPSLAVLAKRAAFHADHDLEVMAVSRFNDRDAREWLDQCGVVTIGCDLLDRNAVASLPESENVVFMAGRKFGTTDQPALTWAMNTIAPANAAERYAGSKIVALSTGCVYPLVKTGSRGSIESDPLTPIGEYSNAAVARERILEYFSERDATPMVHVRLNYALDLRYGVFVDIASHVLAGEPIDLSIGYVNCIWQRDANEAILRAFGLVSSPPLALNVTSREKIGVRDLATRFGTIFGREPVFQGVESDHALLADSSRCHELLGEPATPLALVIQWTADWLRRGGRTLGKPTHYEATDGRF